MPRERALAASAELLYSWSSQSLILRSARSLKPHSAVFAMSLAICPSWLRDTLGADISRVRITSAFLCLGCGWRIASLCGRRRRYAVLTRSSSLFTALCTSVCVGVWVCVGAWVRAALPAFAQVHYARDDVVIHHVSDWRLSACAYDLYTDCILKRSLPVVSTLRPASPHLPPTPTAPSSCLTTTPTSSQRLHIPLACLPLPARPCALHARGQSPAPTWHLGSRPSASLSVQELSGGEDARGRALISRGPRCVVSDRTIVSPLLNLLHESFKPHTFLTSHSLYIPCSRFIWSNLHFLLFNSQFWLNPTLMGTAGGLHHIQSFAVVF